MNVSVTFLETSDVRIKETSVGTVTPKLSRICCEYLEGSYHFVNFPDFFVKQV